MTRECGALWASAVPSVRMALRQQRRPGRVGRVARRRQALLVATGDVDRVQRRPRLPAGVAEEHDHAAVRRPGRALVVIALGQDAFARSVGAHDADAELALILLGEGDIVAARRPHRRRIGAIAETDALRRSAAWSPSSANPSRTGWSCCPAAG